MAIRVDRWGSQGGPLTEEGVRLRHQPPEHFRFRRTNYAAGALHGGIQRAGLCYVLSGTCVFRVGETVPLAAGQFVELPAGAFEFEVTGTDVCTIVDVLEVPPQFR